MSALDTLGEAGEGVEPDDAAVWVVRLVDTAQRRERGEVTSSVDAKLHDHSGNLDDHAVQRVDGEQIGEWLAAQIQGKVVDQFLGRERRRVQ